MSKLFMNEILAKRDECIQELERSAEKVKTIRKEMESFPEVRIHRFVMKTYFSYKKKALEACNIFFKASKWSYVGFLVVVAAIFILSVAFRNGYMDWIKGIPCGLKSIREGIALTV